MQNLIILSVTALVLVSHTALACNPFTDIQDAVAVLEGEKVKGMLSMIQNGWHVDVNGKIEGLTPKQKAAVIVHQYGDMRDGKCEAIGKHYNPYNKNHGDREGDDRHYGDLGNIEADEKGMAEFSFKVKGHLMGIHNFVGRSIAVHEKEDDLGKEDNDESRENGNSDPVKDGIVVFEGTISGMVMLKVDGDKIKVSGEINGLPASKKLGFHIHQYGDVRNSCAAAGGHYNPDEKKHGSPDSDERHFGDMGNIETDAAGKATVSIMIPGNSIPVGRAIVIHSGEDDLGKGGDEGSAKTGNAGSRLTCSVIGIKNTDVS